MITRASMRRSICFLLLAGGLAGCAATHPEKRALRSPPAREVLRGEDAAPRTGAASEGALAEPDSATIYARITVDTGNRPLAAYTVIVRFDPEAVVVRAVLPPGEGGFPGPPVADPTRFRSGTLPILGLHVGPDFPAGVVDVARIRFRALRSGETPFSVTLQALYGPDGASIRGKATGEPPLLEME